MDSYLSRLGRVLVSPPRAFRTRSVEPRSDDATPASPAVPPPTEETIGPEAATDETPHRPASTPPRLSRSASELLAPASPVAPSPDAHAPTGDGPAGNVAAARAQPFEAPPAHAPTPRAVDAPKNAPLGQSPTVDRDAVVDRYLVPGADDSPAIVGRGGADHTASNHDRFSTTEVRPSGHDAVAGDAGALTRDAPRAEHDAPLFDLPPAGGSKPAAPARTRGPSLPPNAEVSAPERAHATTGAASVVGLVPPLARDGAPHATLAAPEAPPSLGKQRSIAPASAVPSALAGARVDSHSATPVDTERADRLAGPNASQYFGGATGPAEPLANAVRRVARHGAAAPANHGVAHREAGSRIAAQTSRSLSTRSAPARPSAHAVESHAVPGSAALAAPVGARSRSPSGVTPAAPATRTSASESSSSAPRPAGGAELVIGQIDVTVMSQRPSTLPRPTRSGERSAAQRGAGELRDVLARRGLAWSALKA
jgi:hypothetical protein